VTVAAGEKKEGLQIQIDAGAKLSGRVADLDAGVPLEGVRIWAGNATTRLSGVSAKDGGFSFAGVSVGHWRIDFQNGETHVPEYKELDVKPGGGDIDVGLVKMMKGNFADRGSLNSRGRIGFTPGVQDGKPTVTGVRPGFPAATAGLKEGDLLLSINGRSVEGLGGGALDYLGAGKVGDPLVVKIQPRDGSAAREVKIDRVPLDFDPSRPASGKPSTTAQARTAP
jgi:hypothetical protein